MVLCSNSLPFFWFKGGDQIQILFEALFVLIQCTSDATMCKSPRVNIISVRYKKKNNKISEELARKYLLVSSIHNHSSIIIINNNSSPLHGHLPPFTRETNTCFTTSKNNPIHFFI